MEFKKNRSRKFTESDIAKLVKILRENNVVRTTTYHEFRTLNNNKCQGITLPSNPWQLFNISAREFFSAVVSGDGVEKVRAENPYYKYKKINRKTLEEHLQLARDNKIYNFIDYSAFVRSLGKPCEYYTYPWHVFKLQVSEFFNLAFDNYKEMLYDKRLRLCATSDLAHVTICMEKQLTNSRKYRKFYLQQKGIQDMLSRPWDRYGMSEKQFFNAVRAKDITAFVRE